MEPKKFNQIAEDLLEVKCRWRRLTIQEVIESRTDFHPRVIAKPRHGTCEECNQCVLDPRHNYWYSLAKKQQQAVWTKKCLNCGKITGAFTNHNK
jgi:hypothetical protein